MTREQFDGNSAVFCVLHLDFAHGEHHHHDLRVYRHVLRQQHPAPLQVCCFTFQANILFLEGFPELLHYHPGEQRLGNKRIHARFRSLLGNILPAVGGQDDDRRLISDDLPDLPCRFHAIQFGHPPVHQNQVIGLPPGMTKLYHLNAVKAGQRLLAADPDLAEDDLRMLAGDGIVIDHQYAHVVRMHHVVFPDRRYPV